MEEMEECKPINCCTICDMNVTNYITENSSLFIETLTKLISTSSVTNSLSDKSIFNYCLECSEILNDVLEFQNQIAILQRDLENKANLIRIKMLQCPPSKNLELEKLRYRSTKEYRPFVQMYSRNSLIALHKREWADSDSEVNESKSRKIPKFTMNIVSDTYQEEEGKVLMVPTEDLSSDTIEALLPATMRDDEVVEIKTEIIKVELAAEEEEENLEFLEQPLLTFDPDSWTEDDTPPIQNDVDPLLIPGAANDPQPSTESTAVLRQKWLKPDLTLPQLMTVAIKNNDDNATHCTSQQIHNFIMDNFPYYKTLSWTEINRYLTDMPFFRALREYDGSVKWTVVDASIGLLGTFTKLIDSLNNLKPQSLAFPEKLENMVLRSSVFWADSAKKDNQLKQKTMWVPQKIPKKTEAEQAVKRWMMPTLTTLEMCVLGVTNTINPDMYATAKEVTEFILLNFPYFKIPSGSGQPLYIRSANIKLLLYHSCFKSDGAAVSRRFTVDEKEVTMMLPLMTEKVKYCGKCLRYPETVETLLQNLCTRKSGQPLIRLPIDEAVNLLLDADFTQLQNNAATRLKFQQKYPEWVKPPFTLAQAVFIALCNGPNRTKRMSTYDIIKFITESFPYYNSFKSFDLIHEVTKRLNSSICIKKQSGPLGFTWSIDYENQPDAALSVKKEIRDRFFSSTQSST